MPTVVSGGVLVSEALQTWRSPYPPQELPRTSQGGSVRLDSETLVGVGPLGWWCPHACPGFGLPGSDPGSVTMDKVFNLFEPLFAHLLSGIMRIYQLHRVAVKMK